MHLIHLLMELYNAMKNGQHCWAEWTKAYAQKGIGQGYQFYCDPGRH